MKSTTASRLLPERCSYVKAAAMSGHRHWCFDAPGGKRVSASDPEKIREPSFLELVASLAPNTEREKSTEPATALAAFAALIVESVAEESEGGNGLAKAINRRYEQLGSDANNNSQPGIQFLQVLIFASMTNCRWFVVG